MREEISDLERAIASIGLKGTLLDVRESARIILKARRGEGNLLDLLLAKVSREKLERYIAEELDLDYIDLFSTSSDYSIDDNIVRNANIDMLRERSALPLVDKNGDVVIAMANPLGDQEMVEYLRSVYGRDIKLGLCDAGQIDGRLIYFENVEDQIKQHQPDTEIDTPVVAVVTDSPVVEWTDNLLARASAEGASDVHFMFNQDGSLNLRFRIDGVLRKQRVPLRGMEGEIITSLVGRCPTIDQTDRNRIQDGTFSFYTANGRRIDTRVNMSPQLYGPTVVVRLLDPKNIQRNLDEMGFSPQNLGLMRAAIKNPQGLVLFIGQTGTGKTTTLYGLLKELDAERLNILTAEDPVEYRLPGIGQTQIRADVKDKKKAITFAGALRSFLRLDPDVILVGEIRDEETAEVALHASITGHLVLSTIHANSVINVFQRLDKMGIDPFLTAEALSLGVAQRLLRRVHDCGIEEPPTASEAAWLQRNGLEVPPTVMHAAERGCPGCGGTGYRGRIPVMETLNPDEELRELIATRAPWTKLAESAAKSGRWNTIFEDGYRHLTNKTVTVSELLRVLGSGDTDE